MAMCSGGVCAHRGVVMAMPMAIELLKIRRKTQPPRMAAQACIESGVDGFQAASSTVNAPRSQHGAVPVCGRTTGGVRGGTAARAHGSARARECTRTRRLTWARAQARGTGHLGAWVCV